MNGLYWLLILLCCGSGSGRSGGCNGNGGGRSGGWSGDGCGGGGRSGGCNGDGSGRPGGFREGRGGGSGRGDRFDDCRNNGFDGAYGRSGEGECCGGDNSFEYDRDGRMAPPPVPRSYQNLGNEGDENCGCGGSNTP